MAEQNELLALNSKCLCYRCVGESYLRAEIRQEGRQRRCSYCKRMGRAYPIGDMAERIELVFNDHYKRTPDQPNSWQQTMLSDRESGYEWERDGEPIIQAIANAADMPEAAAQDIQTFLADKHDDFEMAAMGEETPFADGSYYEERGPSDQAWQQDWSDFEQSMKTESRFFSRTAAAHLASVFKGIETMSDATGRPLVINAGLETSLNAVYRARTFQSDERLEAALCRPDQQLGSPPASFAAAGRMNAQGISVFYGANEPKVAIAEVRPPVGSQVTVARFEIIRPLRLLDLTALSAVAEEGSIFDPEFGNRLDRAMFLRSLSRRITKPVMPDDQAFEYLPTQAIADFLATESDLAIDGIAFPSVQAAGNVLNIVLFHKAALVEPLEFPKGTEIQAHTRQMYDEGWEPEYVVIEQTSPTAEAAVPDDGFPNFETLIGLPWSQSDTDFREAALRIDLASIKVHKVRGVEIDTIEYDVRRHRWEKHEYEF